MRHHRHRMPSSRPRWVRTLVRCTVAGASVVALMATALGWSSWHGLLGGITVSQALGAEEPHSTGGAMNILLIGLDSRKDQHGNELPQEVLDQLHAGDSDSGGYNTNTMILVHVGADDKVVAFSIPRDDYVAFSGVPGYRHIKIKEAYGLTKAYTAQKLVDQGVSDQEELETAGREAGRKATIKAVRNLTGAPIDYFAEVNLASFYDIAQSLGGIEVCLKHAVHDEYSGADFAAGRQTLDAAQALAFVRQRHGLENGDLDRTHRQQAFLISVMQQLQKSGSFTDIGKLSALMDVARKDIVLSQGWGEEQFKRMAALAGGNVEFRTLPVLRYENIGGQDVNIVDPAAIRAEVAAAFGITPTTTPPPLTVDPPNPATVVDVINASSTSGAATEVSNRLAQHGFSAGQIRDPYASEPTETMVDFGPGGQPDAKNVARLLGIDVADSADDNLSDNHIRVMLGEDFSIPGTATSTDNTSSSEPTTESAQGWLATTSTPTPDSGRPVDGGDGVPCVN